MSRRDTFLFLHYLRSNRNLYVIKMLRQTTSLRICKDCVFFRPNPKFWSFDKNAIIYGHCEKFGKTDLVTGDVELAFASLCRENEAQCGQVGTYYNQKFKVQNPKY